ncbi:MAG: DUF6502 family protein [Woeseiaceae bacterium]|nr:DUF6502 family protein [Woeseiaceae bacterium]
MQDTIQKQILDAFFVVLKPIARILLRYGIGFREFSEVAKSAFVDVATKDYGIRGRPTNISRVAVMTGLTRKEVRRLRDQLETTDQAYSVRSTPLARVLAKWHSESEFLDETGEPAVLDFAGEGKSFSALVKKFGGDIPPGAMRTELKRVGAVVEQDDGRIQALRRSVQPKVDHENLCVALAHGAYPILSSIAHNTNPELSESAWAQRTAYSANISPGDVSRLRRICSDRAGDTVESFDDLFMAYEQLNEERSQESRSTPVVFGVYYFEERDPDATSMW